MKKIFFLLGILVALSHLAFAQQKPYTPQIEKGVFPDQTIPDMRNHPMNDEIMRTAPIIIVVTKTKNGKPFRTEEGNVYTSQLLEIKEVLRGSEFVKPGPVEILFGIGEDDSPLDRGQIQRVYMGADSTLYSYIIVAKPTTAKDKGSIFKTTNPNIENWEYGGTDIGPLYPLIIEWWTDETFDARGLRAFHARGLQGMAFESKQEFEDYFKFYGIKSPLAESEKKNVVSGTNEEKITTNACTAPFNLAAFNITGSSATLSWNGGGFVSTQLEYKPSNTSNWIAIVPANFYNHTLTGLLPYTSYDYRVAWTCQDGTTSPYSAVFTFSTIATGVITEVFPLNIRGGTHERITIKGSGFNIKKFV